MQYYMISLVILLAANASLVFGQSSKIPWSLKSELRINYLESRSGDLHLSDGNGNMLVSAEPTETYPELNVEAGRSDLLEIVCSPYIIKLAGPCSASFHRTIISASEYLVIELRIGKIRVVGSSNFLRVVVMTTHGILGGVGDLVYSVDQRESVLLQVRAGTGWIEDSSGKIVQIYPGNKAVLSDSELTVNADETD